LNFDYEIILDARTFEHPANYALLRIVGSGADRIEQCVDESKSPAIILEFVAPQAQSLKIHEQMKDSAA
jgi:hypothetical protein